MKAQLQRRFGAAVAETDHHDLWQRSELSAALVGREAGTVAGHPGLPGAMGLLPAIPRAASTSGDTRFLRRSDG